MGVVEHLRSGIEYLPPLAKFAVAMVIIVVVPKLARRVRLPEAVALLLTGVAGRAFGYAPAARKTMWSLTLRQLAATLAATLVANRTVNAAGQPLIDGRILNSVLVMVLFTAIVGPVLTQRYAPHMREPGTGAGDVSI